MTSLKGGTPRASQQKVDIGGESYIVADEDQVTQAGGGARSWSVTQTPLQDADTSKEFSISLGDFSQGAGFTFATQPGVYDYANGWDASAPGKPGTWARRATGASLPPTVDYQGWILPASTYVYVMRGRFCSKYAMDDTQDAVWPIIETHDFGSDPVAFGESEGEAGLDPCLHDRAGAVPPRARQQQRTILGRQIAERQRGRAVSRRPTPTAGLRCGGGARPK